MEHLQFPRTIQSAQPMPTETHIHLPQPPVSNSSPKRQAKVVVTQSTKDVKPKEPPSSPLGSKMQDKSPESMRKRLRTSLVKDSPISHHINESPFKLTAATIECEDGHLVSTNEAKIIDNWLYNHNIVHRIQPR